jgi:F420H(2)-dependent quinone reductase
VLYLPDDSDPDVIYIFASKGGAPSNPDWYCNPLASGSVWVKRGPDVYRSVVTEVAGPAQHARPGTAGRAATPVPAHGPCPCRQAPTDIARSR